jgi:hypothetical protein
MDRAVASMKIVRQMKRLLCESHLSSNGWPRNGQEPWHDKKEKSDASEREQPFEDRGCGRKGHDGGPSCRSLHP